MEQGFNWLDYGITGAVFAFALMFAERTFKWAEKVIEEKRDKKTQDDQPERRVYSQEIIDKLTMIQTDFDKLSVTVGAVKDQVLMIKSTAQSSDLRIQRLEKAVIDGNGRESLKTQVARVDERLSNHIGDRGLHTTER